MNKKTVLIAGLIGTIAASIFGATISIADTNPIKTLSLNEASGAKVDRSVTVVDFARKGFYLRQAKEGGIAFENNTFVSFGLSNPGTYGYIETISSDSGQIVNIEDGLFKFMSQPSVDRIMYFSFDHEYDFYNSQSDAQAEVNKLPIYNFAHQTVSSIVIKMGKDNQGAIKTDENISYDSSTDSYTFSPAYSMSGVFIKSTEYNKYFHIESITFNYNC